MADRYWVTSGGNWTDTANWSAASGGPPGASVPTASDNVFFDSFLTTYGANIYVTIFSFTTTPCLNFNSAGYTGTINMQGGSSSIFQINGNLVFSGLLSFQNGAYIVLNGSSKTITSNGNTVISEIQIAVGASYTLLDSFSQSSSVVNGISISGNFNTAGSSIIVNSFTVLSGGVLSLGSSAVSVRGSFTANTGSTFNGGTSTITFTDSSSTSFIGAIGVSTTFYNVILYGVRTQPTNLYGNNTYNNLTILSQPITAFKYNYVAVTGTQTVNGTLTLQSGGSNAAELINLASSTSGTQKTIYVDTIAAGSGNFNFCDIAIIGPAAPISGTSFGDQKGNSGITFTAPKTVYWVGGTGNAYDTTRWASTSGGSGSSANYPLPQDTIIIDDASGISGSALNLRGNAGFYSNFWLTTITMTARTLPFTLSGGLTYYANMVTSSVATVSSLILFFDGRTTQQLTSNGKTFSSVTILSGTTLSIQDNFSVSARLENYGVFNTNNFSVTQTSTTTGGYYGYAGSALNMGTSLLTFAGYGGWNDGLTGRLFIFVTNASAAVTGSGTLSFTSNNASLGKVVNIAGSCSQITINQGGSGRLSLYALNTNVTYADITNTYAATGATSIFFLCPSNGIVKVNNFSLAGSAGKLCTIVNSIYPGRVTIQKPSGVWYVGANSVNGGQVSGAVFTAGSSIDYLSISRVNFTTPENGFFVVM